MKSKSKDSRDYLEKANRIVDLRSEVKPMLKKRYAPGIGIRSLAAALMIGNLGLWPAETSMAADASVTYQYDAAGRLISASYNNNLCIAYTYDLNGNRLTETTGACTTAGPGAWGSFNWNQAPWG